MVPVPVSKVIGFRGLDSLCLSHANTSEPGTVNSTTKNYFTISLAENLILQRQVTALADPDTGGGKTCTKKEGRVIGLTEVEGRL
jgi:hypothetical protein